VLAAVVGMVVLAVLLPLYDLTNAIGEGEAGRLRALPRVDR
jgi:hypothetical protein